MSLSLSFLIFKMGIKCLFPKDVVRPASDSLGLGTTVVHERQLTECRGRTQAARGTLHVGDNVRSD